MVVVAAFPDGVDGLALTDPHAGNTVLAVGQTVHWERQGFALAHELGHLIAGGSWRPLLSGTDTRSASTSSGKEVEQQ